MAKVINAKHYYVWTNHEVMMAYLAAQLKAEHPDYSDEELQMAAEEMNADILNDARENLDIKLGEPIIVIADISRVTKRIGDVIGKVYGWTFKGGTSA